MVLHAGGKWRSRQPPYALFGAGLQIAQIKAPIFSAEKKRQTDGNPSCICLLLYQNEMLGLKVENLIFS